ncbi:MAG TPA: glycosyltransferase, partial [Solirubrobacteraceae bacterium]|nr:glycosyltransferase [Solirubrobacteraceae bacterium]
NCWPEFDPEFAHQLSFVANTRGVHRQIMRDLLPTPHDLAVWGAGWRGLIPDRCIKGESLNNDQLRRAYSSAELVLNDHMDDQRRHGIINNRIYDVLACGGCVLSDHLPELDAEFGGIVATYRTPEDLRATVGRLLADPDERAERAARGRELVLRAHTFADRAQTLLEAVSARL